MKKPVLSLIALLGLVPLAEALPAVDYDVVYVRQARFGDTTNTIWPDVFHPARLDPGADLMLLHPDGSEEVLVAAGNGGVTDPFISFDAQWCYYSLFPDLRSNQLNYQRGNLPYAGSDIYRIHLKTRQIQRLTNQEFTPNTGTGNWDPSNPVNPSSSFNRLGYGILNLAPCPLAGGKIAFTSNRRGYVPPNGYTTTTQQLYVMDEDGQNVTPIAPMSIGSALHPTPLTDGRIMFSSYESQGLRDQRMWGIWTIRPDGRAWAPLVSAFHAGQAFHFMTQLSSTDVVVEDYYNLNNNGFGALYKTPLNPPAGQPGFFSAMPSNNPAIPITTASGLNYSFKMSFTPRGFQAMTPFTTPEDEAAPTGPGGVRKGKFTHPSGAPGNDCLVVWTPGPANNLDRPTTTPRYDAGIYLIKGGGVVTDPAQLVLLKNSPAYNEAWPRAVVPYRAVHGIDEPAKLPWLPNDGTAHPSLPKGTPYGIVGTSSFYKRESAPGRGASSYAGMDVFNTSENDQSSNWGWQGSDAGRYTNSEIHAVRILAMEPNSHRSYGPHLGGPSNDGNHFISHARERLRILGEIPLRKKNTDGTPVLDPEGNPDTSFMAIIPADTPFTFQTIDKDGLVLNMAQTWHQVRPGEVRTDCGGCHAHSQQPLAIGNTAAGKPGYQPVDLTAYVSWLTKDGAGETIVQNKPAGAVNVEFIRDIRPILDRSCVAACHTKNNSEPAGNLVLDDRTISNFRPGDYARLASDSSAQWGHKPVISNKTWRQTNASRYVRQFQSRRSLLIWKIFGRRLDGWTNADHPTETTPGDAATLPAGASANNADLDYTGDIMPPPGSGVPPLTEDEKMLFARWVDLGCPLNSGTGTDANYGWFTDELPPTLTISSPRPDKHVAPLTEIRIGIADANTGIQSGSLSIKAAFTVNGAAPGAELAGQGTFVSPGIFVIPLLTPLLNLDSTTLTAGVRDGQGNKSETTVRFWVRPPEISLYKCDPAELPSRRLTLHVKDDFPNAQHRVTATSDLSALIWTDISIIGTVKQDDLYQLKVEVPSQFATRCFLRVER
ncbi:MAG TPA: hypothetical protein VG796_19015 [Verrucomicrobiales bacterium]|nr:hypothetical protein [Verrucomicrobiales bacterium]